MTNNKELKEYKVRYITGTGGGVNSKGEALLTTNRYEDFKVILAENGNKAMETVKKQVLEKMDYFYFKDIDRL